MAIDKIARLKMKMIQHSCMDLHACLEKKIQQLYIDLFTDKITNELKEAMYFVLPHK